jgi:hypothetical protein
MNTRRWAGLGIVVVLYGAVSYYLSNSNDLAIAVKGNALLNYATFVIAAYAALKK